MTPGQRSTLEAVALMHREGMRMEGSPFYLRARGGRVAVCRALVASGILQTGDCVDDGAEDDRKMFVAYGFTPAGEALARTEGIALHCPCEDDPPGKHVDDCPYSAWEPDEAGALGTSGPGGPGGDGR